MAPDQPDTYFASPERSSADELIDQQRRLAAEPSLSKVLDAFPEPAMVLNQHRQIVLANSKLAALVDSSAEELLGRRHGEALRCIHSNDRPAGCGTTKFCRYCGAAQALATSQSECRVDVRECRITRAEQATEGALDLRVWATPLETADGQFTIFAMRDTTDEKRRAVLERLFFHDVLNSAAGLRALLEIWPRQRSTEGREMTHLAQEFAEDLVDQIEAQRDLALAEHGDLEVKLVGIDVATFLGSLCAGYRQLARERAVILATPVVSPSATVRSDVVLLRRVLGNLIKNAIEASTAGQTVTVAFEDPEQPTFHVHNQACMTEAVRAQIFQRSFSTKNGNGRGIGSYSVKLLTERYLGGRVTFASTEEKGTMFSVRLPASTHTLQ